MSVKLHKPAHCKKCGALMPAGTRVDRSGAGWSATYSHYNWSCPKQAAAPVVHAPATDRATERQVRYALDLQAAYWTPAVFGGQRYTEAGLRAMSREQVSAVISDLEYERSL